MRTPNRDFKYIEKMKNENPLIFLPQKERENYIFSVISFWMLMAINFHQQHVNFDNAKRKEGPNFINIR